MTYSCLYQALHFRRIIISLYASHSLSFLFKPFRSGIYDPLA